MNVAQKCILREVSLKIAQLSTARQERLWLQFSLSATIAFFVFCVPRQKALDEVYKRYILLHRSDLKFSAKSSNVFANSK